MTVSNTPFNSKDAQRVADAVCAAFLNTLKERLTAFIVHGSAVTGFIPGFSDFDFVVFSHGELTIDDAFEVQRSLGTFNAGPFSYIQLSRLVDVDDPLERRNGLIEGAYIVVHGALPSDWSLHSPQLLRERGLQALRRVPSEVQRLRKDWAVANEHQRRGLVRYLATVLKPAVRGLLCELGDPALKVWRSPYPALARRLRAFDPELADQMTGLLALLPPNARTEEDLARRFFSVLEAVHRAETELKQ